MKIIKRGKKIKQKSKKLIRCDDCKCIYIANVDDLHLSKTIFNVPAFYANCPECKYPNFYQKAHYDWTK